MSVQLSRNPSWGGSRLLHRSITIVLCAIGLVVGVLVARRVTSTSWPLEGARMELALAAGAAYLASFVFRALGWRQLFRPPPDRIAADAWRPAVPLPRAEPSFRFDSITSSRSRHFADSPA